MILNILGAPGAGKGTQADMIEKQFGLRHHSTGDLLRAAYAEGSDLGRLAKGYMDAGRLVPDDVILGIIHDYLTGHPGERILFDGFPRTLPQAEGLAKMAQADHPVSLVLQVPDEKVISRLSSRRVCRVCGRVYNPAMGIAPLNGRCECGGEIYQRDDDRPETVRTRLEVYHRQTEPIIDYYRRLQSLVEVDGDGSPEAVFERVKKALIDIA